MFWTSAHQCLYSQQSPCLSYKGQASTLMHKARHTTHRPTLLVTSSQSCLSPYRVSGWQLTTAADVQQERKVHPVASYTFSMSEGVKCQLDFGLTRGSSGSPVGQSDTGSVHRAQPCAWDLTLLSIAILDFSIIYVKNVFIWHHYLKKNNREIKNNNKNVPWKIEWQIGATVRYFPLHIGHLDR